MHYVIYDGNCNLCSNLVQALEQIDRGQQFQYISMQDQSGLAQFDITTQDCEQGMILINAAQPSQRWQGSAAAEEIGRLLPLGQPAVELYRAFPGLKWLGDRLYAHVRDHRYQLFGQRLRTYQSRYPLCDEDICSSRSTS